MAYQGHHCERNLWKDCHEEDKIFGLRAIWHIHRSIYKICKHYRQHRPFRKKTVVHVVCMLPNTDAIKYTRSEAEDCIEKGTNLISATLGHQFFNEPDNGYQGNKHNQNTLYPHDIQKFDPATQAVVFFLGIDWVFVLFLIFCAWLVGYVLFSLSLYGRNFFLFCFFNKTVVILF